MPLKPWTVIKSEYLRPHIRIDTCRLADGKILKTTILEYGAWVSILALTARQEVVLIRQYRHGQGEVIWELPGGVVDPADGSPAHAARRELLEETGYRSEHVIQVGIMSPDSAMHTNRMYCFLALDAEQVDVQHLDDSEEIEVSLVPLEEVIRMARRGELPQAPQIAALFFALSHLERIS